MSAGLEGKGRERKVSPMGNLKEQQPTNEDLLSCVVWCAVSLLLSLFLKQSLTKPTMFTETFDVSGFVDNSHGWHWVKPEATCGLLSYLTSKKTENMR